MKSMKPEDFPILCETCLGENPYLRMTRESYGKACKICDRPFTIYRWRPGPKARFKKTEVCPTCAKLKNVCQTCILDLDYGLPVQVRDSALTAMDKQDLLTTMPYSTTNRDYLYEQLESGLATRGGTGTTGTGTGTGTMDGNGALQLPYDKVAHSHPMLSRLQRKGPYYKRNLSHICSFYVKGTCNRGDACPYRHELPNDDTELSDQNIKDRFYGINDPVAKKLLAKHEEWKNHKYSPKDAPAPPTDSTIRTLFIGGIDHSVNDEHIRAKLQDFGTITSVHLFNDKGYGFITYQSRTSAEAAMKAWFDNLWVGNKRLKLDWGKTRTGTGIGTTDIDLDFDNNVAFDISTNQKEKEKEKDNNNNNNNNNSNNSNKNSEDKEKEKVQYTEEEKVYLQTQGIIPPERPPMPDPVQIPPPPGMGSDNRFYQSMNANYQAAAIDTTGYRGNRNDRKNIYHYPDTMQ